MKTRIFYMPTDVQVDIHPSQRRPRLFLASGEEILGISNVEVAGDSLLDQTRLTLEFDDVEFLSVTEPPER